MNGTSDLPFERYKLKNGLNLMENNPNVQFIDYTKIKNRFQNHYQKLFSLTFSQSENNLKDTSELLKTNTNIAVVLEKNYQKNIKAVK